MPKKSSLQPADVELEILNVLWDHGPSTVRAIHNILAVKRDTGYSTTLKMMQVMLAKGLLLRNDEVRPQLYRPSKKQAKTQIGLLDSLALKAFGGSAKNMVASLVSNKRLSGEELAELKELLAEAGNTNKKER
jgi:BlaI family penicillinase repressor